MTLRSRARSLLMQAAVAGHADELFLQFHKPDPRSQALVVAMHETPANLESSLRAQLDWASKHFRIGTLDDLAELWTRRNGEAIADRRPLLLFTFDDGRESNYTIAAPVLESFGGRGVFFIVPGFAEDALTDHSLSFYRSRLNPDCGPNREVCEDWRPMNPAQIADLANRGHSIGNHTSTHRRLQNLSPAELEFEIGDSARRLASWIGKAADAFAWTFSWDAIDKDAWEVVRRYHRFCFAPCAGVVDASSDDPSLLWRREIEARYSPPEYRLCYSGLMDLWWAGRRKQLRRMLKPTSGIPE
jgi:peptidoglycan/xylan/chitin deacetylase (PgdA/CDA1 family)